MGKSLLYRLFGLGKIPKKLRPELEAEGVVIADEGMPGWYVVRKLKAPGRYQRGRREGFSGCLVVTKRRIVCYTYGKRQIHIGVDAPKLGQLYVEAPEPDKLAISFESGKFREGWEGVLEFRFTTDQAQAFEHTLTELGASQGHATNANA